MSDKYLTAALLFGAAVLIAVVWELWLAERIRTPVPDAFKKAFESGN